MHTAYGYVRVSGRDQIDADGFVRQELAIRQYGTAHGYSVEAVFREEGVSGTMDQDDRPALLELLETVNGRACGSVRNVIIRDRRRATA